MAPQVGLEPTTTRLTAECSTIELLRSIRRNRLFHYTKCPLPCQTNARCMNTGTPPHFNVERQQVLNPNEKPPLVHPIANQPQHRQHCSTFQRLFKRRPKYGEYSPPKMHLQRLANKPINQMHQTIHGNGVHTHHRKWQRPTSPLFDVHGPIKQQQQPASAAACKQCPGWRPNSFHHGTNSNQIQQPSGNDPRSTSL